MIKEKEIVDTIADRLATITIANGYYTNAGNNVVVWSNFPFRLNELPAYEVRDTAVVKEANQTEGPDALVLYLMQVEINIISGDIDVLRQAKADLLKLIGEDLTWDGYAIHTNFIQTNKVLEQEENRLLGETVLIQIQFRTKNWSEE